MLSKLVTLPSFATAICVGGLLCLAFPNVGNATTSSTNGGQCRLQEPQAFLKRTGFVRHGQLSPARHARAVRYRVEHYGSVEAEGFDLEPLNAERAPTQALGVKFMGLWVNVHKKIATAL